VAAHAIVKRLAAGLLALLLTAVAHAQGPQGPAQDPVGSGLPVLLSADRLTHDEDLGVVTATGNVEVAQGDRVLLADTLTYNQRDNVVTASGNVALIEPTGEVFFSDYVELRDDMKAGVIRDIGLLLTDNSRLAGNGARRTGGNRTELSKGVFTPCEVCAEDPTPLWQVKAETVVHDQDAKEIRYTNAWLEMFGVPVAYTPYFSHPDPTVERKSGFLAPSFGQDQNLGFRATIPYYFVISRDRDLTVTPIFFTRERPALALEYRQRFSNGELEMAGSFTLADRIEVDPATGFQTTREDRIRAHVDGRGRFNIDDTWRWGFDVQRASDRTYLDLYDFSNEDVLASRLFVEGFNGRNYAVANIREWQDLRPFQRSARTPMVLPEIDYNWMSEALPYGGRFHFDANVLNLRRKQGVESRRLSLAGGWYLPWVSPFGDVYTVSATMRGDLYFAENVPIEGTRGQENGFTGRLFPQLAVEWRYPWALQTDFAQYIIEPIVQGSLAPNGGNPRDIPNEDSQDLEFDDTNLLSLNRFTGLDRVESGQRFVLGMRAAMLFDNGGYVTAFAGQSYRRQALDVMPDGSGLETRTSDYVGRVEFAPHRYFDLLYRFRLGSGDLDIRRTEVTASFGPPIFRVSGDYLLLREIEGEFGDRQEINARASSRFTDNWMIYGSVRRDLEEDGSWINYGAGLIYEDECFTWQLDWRRSFTRDEGIEAGDNFFTRLVFKYLGEVSL
jgi:LPS-assembly protein